MKNALTPLAKTLSIPLKLTAAAPATDAAIPEKSGSCTIVLIILNEKIEDIMKIIKSLDDSGLLIKGISEKMKDEAKKQRGEFLSMLLCANIRC